MSRTLNIVVAEDDTPMREYLRDRVTRLGHRVVVAEGGRQLVELCRTAPPDLVITDVKMADLDGLEAAAEVNRARPVPVVLVSAYHEDELLARAGEGADHIMAYLVKPVKQGDVEAAIALAMARFEHLQAIRREADTLRQALEDRKLIERAKGILIRRLGVDEEDAFRRLRKASSDQNRKVVEVARDLLAAEKVFAGLEDVPGRIAREPRPR